MTVIALITAHSRELLRIAKASVLRHAPAASLIILPTHISCVPDGDRGRLVPHLPGGAANHATAIAYGRRLMPHGDIFLCLDDDTVILSDDFLPTLQAAFDDPAVGAWGAAGIRDPLHPSCIAFRRDLFLKVTTFAASLPYHDTTGIAQAEIQAWGYSLRPMPRVVLDEGWEAFTPLSEKSKLSLYPTSFQVLWAHLGGGVIHAPVSPLRRLARHVKAACGSEASRDLIVKAKMRELWLERYGH